MSVYYDFDKDLNIGKGAEDEALKKIKEAFPGISNIEQSSSKEYDVMGEYKGEKITFEIKCDIMASKTGNAAIEYESRGVSSGIETTKANYWIHKIDEMFYLFQTNIIKQNLKKGLFFKKVIGGDPGSNTKMYLVKVGEFIKWGKRI